MLEPWVVEILADPVSKQPASLGQFRMSGTTIDARHYLKNTVGFGMWDKGQTVYETWQTTTAEDHQADIEGDRDVYQHIRMSGRILDVGGGPGTVRHFLPAGVQFLSIDPFIDYERGISQQKRQAYPCLSQPLNFIAACAEFLPIQSSTFDWVHMRSMLDHAHSPDLALMEAKRVLKPGGKLVVGLYVDGGKTGKRPIDRKIKESIRSVLVLTGIDRFKDHHTFHPSFANLQKIIGDNGFEIEDVYWQPRWKDQVCYITARP